MKSFLSFLGFVISSFFSIFSVGAQTTFDKVQLGPHLELCRTFAATVDATGGYTLLGIEFDEAAEKVVKRLSAFTSDHQPRWSVDLPDSFRLVDYSVYRDVYDFSADAGGVSLLSPSLSANSVINARRYSNNGDLLTESTIVDVLPVGSSVSSLAVDEFGGARISDIGIDELALVAFDHGSNIKREVRLTGGQGAAHIFLFESRILLITDDRAIAIDRQTLEIINEISMSSYLNPVYPGFYMQAENSLLLRAYGPSNGQNENPIVALDIGTGSVELEVYPNPNFYTPVYTWGPDSLVVENTLSSTGYSVIHRVGLEARELDFLSSDSGDLIQNFAGGPKVNFRLLRNLNTVGLGIISSNVVTRESAILCADESTWVTPPKSISSLAILADGSVVGTSNLSNELLHVAKNGLVSVFGEIPSQVLTDTPVWVGGLDGDGDMLAVIRRGVLDDEAVTEVQVFNVLNREVVQTHLLEGFFRSVHSLSPEIGAGQVVVVEYYGEGGGVSDFNRNSLVYRFDARGNLVESFDASEVMQQQGLFVPLVSKVDVNALNEMVMHGFAGNVDTTTREFGRFTAVLNSSRSVMNITNRINAWETLPPVIGYASDNGVVSSFRVNNGFQFGILDPNDFSSFSQTIGPVIDGFSSADDGRIIGDSIYFYFNDTSLGIRTHKIGFMDYLRPVAKVDSLIYYEVDPNERVGLTTKITNHGIALSVQDHYLLASNYVLLESDGISSTLEGIPEARNSLTARSPFKNQLYFSCNSKADQVEILSLSGVVLEQLLPVHISNEDYFADISVDLVPGAYVLRVGNESVVVVKVR